MDISERLKNAREIRGIEQKEVASILKVSVSTVSGWETGYRVPPLRKFIKLAELYETSLDYLVGFEKNNSINKKDLQKLLFELKQQVEKIEIYINNTK